MSCLRLLLRLCILAGQISGMSSGLADGVPSTTLTAGSSQSSAGRSQSTAVSPVAATAPVTVTETVYASTASTPTVYYYTVAPRPTLDSIVANASFVSGPGAAVTVVSTKYVLASASQCDNGSITGSAEPTRTTAAGIPDMATTTDRHDPQITSFILDSVTMYHYDRWNQGDEHVAGGYRVCGVTAVISSPAAFATQIDGEGKVPGGKKLGGVLAREDDKEMAVTWLRTDCPRAATSTRVMPECSSFPGKLADVCIYNT